MRLAHRHGFGPLTTRAHGLSRLQRRRVRRWAKRVEADAARAELDYDLERFYLEPPLGACDGDCAWCVNPPPWDADLLADSDPRALLGLTSRPVTARLPL